MVGGQVGGVNVFSGGLALYNSSQVLVGALGVSGDSSCADRNMAWRTRKTLALDHVPAGVSAKGWGLLLCAPGVDVIAVDLPKTK
jgi:hypothetical protein